ncbi:unnamed protein product [Lampetra planeri]
MCRQNGMIPYDEDSAEKKGSDVDFVVRMKEVAAQEQDDALFECVLTQPLPTITWTAKGKVLEDGEKYSITVSDHKLIHRLIVKDCTQHDKAIYSATAAESSCSAWLIVEDETDPPSAGTKKTGRRLVGGAGADLERVAKEQQTKNREEMEKILAAARANHDVGQLTGSSRREGDLKKVIRAEEMGAVFEAAESSGWFDGVEANPNNDNASDSVTHPETSGKVKQKVKRKKTNTCDDDNDDDSTDRLERPTHSKPQDGVDGESTSLNEQSESSETGAAAASRRKRHGPLIEDLVTDPGVQFVFGLSDVSAIVGATAELTCKLSSEDCVGGWFRDGKKNAIFKLQFVGHQPIKIQWYREGEELLDDSTTKIEKSNFHSRLLLSRCQRKGTGEIKIKLKNEDGFVEAISQLTVLDKPTAPLGPAEVTDSSPTCIEFRWRPPKDDGGSPVINYIMERQQVGRNTWKKIGESPGLPSYRDTNVERGRKYCYRIRAATAEGVSDVMETDEMQAGTLGKTYAVKDVVAGMAYEFRVTAINLSGVGEFSNPCEFVFARDPKKPPGKVTSLKLTETSYNHLVLTWTKPEEKPNVQDEAKGYFVEIRPAECLEWSRCNSSPIITTSFSVKGLKSMDMYWDNVPVKKKVTVSNSDGSSQLLIPSSERCDSGIYSIVVKNLAGQETFSTEVRVTDDPKPPGPVELEENVPGTVTVTWEPSPDENGNDRLHYTVSALDSTKRTWTTVAERLFNNKFTVCNIMHGREYHFRVYAKNDMGVSAPSESPTWGMQKKKVCSMLILRVGPKDTGEYTMTAENALGRAECTTVLSVQDAHMVDGDQAPPPLRRPEPPDWTSGPFGSRLHPDLLHVSVKSRRSSSLLIRAGGSEPEL